MEFTNLTSTDFKAFNKCFKIKQKSKISLTKVESARCRFDRKATCEIFKYFSDAHLYLC